jgi:hypothetical protein
MNPNFQEYLEQTSEVIKKETNPRTQEFLNKLFALMDEYKASIGASGKRDGTCFVSVFIGNHQFEDVEFSEEIDKRTETQRILRK